MSRSSMSDFNPRTDVTAPATVGARSMLLPRSVVAEANQDCSRLTLPFGDE